MNILVWLLQNTPLPWLAAMYLIAYRHDLFRIAKPFSDHSSLTEWWYVCSHLNLISAHTSQPIAGVMRNKSLLTLMVVTIAGVDGPMFFQPQDWYYLIPFQLGLATVLFVVLINRIGPLPAKPYRDVLAYPRLGTRIRHLQMARGAEREPLIISTPIETAVSEQSSSGEP